MLNTYMPICSIWGSHFCRFLLCQNLIIFISQVFSTYLLYLFILFMFIEVAPKSALTTLKKSWFQRSGHAQETIICLFGLLFFSQNGMTLKKTSKISKLHWKVTGFWDIIKVCSILAGPNQLDELKWVILLLLTPKSSLEKQ